MKKIYALLVLYFTFCLATMQAQTTIPIKDSVSKTYPVPPESKHMLFYLQRTHNTNTIVYAINYNADSTINEKEPVKVYWIRYADKGETLPLTSVQKQFAYGVESKEIDKEKKWFKINLTAYNKTEIFIMNSTADKNYKAFTKINGKMAILKRVFFKTDGGTFWNPNVVYVELAGKEIANGKPTLEQFKP